MPQFVLGPDDPVAVGPYHLAAVLGAGSTGKVYLGHTALQDIHAAGVTHRDLKPTSPRSATWRSSPPPAGRPVSNTAPSRSAR